MTSVELSNVLRELNRLSKKGSLYIKTGDMYEWVVDVLRDPYGIVILSRKSITQTGCDSRIYSLNEFEDLITNHYTKEETNTEFERYVISTNLIRNNLSIRLEG